MTYTGNHCKNEYVLSTFLFATSLVGKSRQRYGRLSAQDQNKMSKLREKVRQTFKIVLNN